MARVPRDRRVRSFGSFRKRVQGDAEQIIDLATDLVASIGFDGRYRRLSPSFVRTFGYSEPELMSRLYAELIHPDDRPAAQEEFAKVVQGKQLVEYENRCVCADGSVRIVQWKARAVTEQRVLYAIGRDVTERRYAEREFEEIFNLSPDLLCIAGTDGYFKRVNRAFADAFGYTNEELLSRPLLEFAHPDDLALSHEAFVRLSRGEEIPRFENRNIRADGSTLWLEWSTYGLPKEGILYGAARDITERKRAEAELRDAQETIEASGVQLAVYAADQAALRRVATLVAEGAAPTTVFEAVASEVSELLGSAATSLIRYDPDGAATVLAVDRESAAVDRVDARLTLQGAVEAPIVVEGRVWGTIAASSRTDSLPPDAAERLAHFTDVIATAIGNAESRAEVAASRARVVAASADERRRVVRDLHDGAQQRLVHAVIALKLALRAHGSGDERAKELVREALDHAEQANSALRELAHGVLPHALTRGGLRAAVQDLAARSALPVAAEVSPERLPPAIEATAYFVVSEALTNAVKHASAEQSEVKADVEGGVLRVEVRDDGVGGADPRGSGLTGLRDRVEALGGTIEIGSRAESGTSLVVEIPLDEG